MRMRKKKRRKKFNEKSTWFSEVRFYIESIAFLVIEMGFWSLYVAFNYRIDCNNLRIRIGNPNVCVQNNWSRVSQSRVAHYSVIAFSDKIVYIQRFSVFCLQLNIYHKFYILKVAFYCALIRKAQTDSVTVAIMKPDIAICILLTQSNAWDRKRKTNGL